MDRIIITVSLVVALSGCQSIDRSFTSTLKNDSYTPVATETPELGIADTTTVENVPNAEPPVPNPAPLNRDNSGSVVPVVYQIEEESETHSATKSPPASDLTLLDLEGMALQSNPAVAQAAALVRAAQGHWVQVGLPPNLVLGYSGQQLGSNGEAEQQGVFIGQEFLTGKKLQLNRQVACWEIQKAQRELESVRLRVLTDVRVGHYDVLIAQRRRELAAELVRISIQGVEAAEALFRSEEVSEADPLRARVEADTARILLQNSINQHHESWRRLTAVLGMPEMGLQRIDGELDAHELAISWEDQLERVLTESPEMAAALATVEAARWSVQRAYAEVVPNLDVQAVIQDDRGTGSTNGNLQVSMPIPLWNRNQGGIRKARAEATAASQHVDRLALNLQSRLASVFQRYESANNQVEQYSRPRGIIENSEKTLELIRTGYQSEEFGVLDFLTAQRTYFQTNLAYLDSLRELWFSVTEINGLLLQDSLSE